MKVVIDTNVIISILIKLGKPIDLFLKENLEIFAPEFILEELQNNRDMIIRKSKVSEEEISVLFSFLTKKIKFISEKEFISHFDEAEKICPDEKDIIFFALALHLKCPLWTNEKRLKKQEVVKVYATHELMQTL